MITIKDFMETVNYRITEGYEYQWNCFGYNAYGIDSWVSENYTISVIFDTKTQVVYQSEAHDYVNNRSYRWTNPEYAQKHAEEAKERGIDSNNAFDDVNFVNLDVEEDFLEKAAAIFNGESFDSRIQVPLTLDKDELYKLMSMAHERDITLNKMVEIILLEMIERQNESTGFDNDAFY